MKINVTPAGYLGMFALLLFGFIFTLAGDPWDVFVKVKRAIVAQTAVEAFPPEPTVDNYHRP